MDVFKDSLRACKTLAEKDPILARALDAIGAPYIRRRPGGFAGLFRIIVEQQVSVPAAQAILARCEAGIALIDADTISAMTPEALCALGLSRPKVRYISALAEAVGDGRFTFDALQAMDDEAASAALQAHKGIGPWSAAIYLLFCEGRIDVWPPGDVALLGAWRSARRGGPVPDMASLDKRAQKWTPYRGVAAHILWTYYAKLRGRSPI